MAYFLQGDYRQAMDACRRAMALLEGEQRYERFGQSVLPAVHSRTYLSFCLAEVGAFAEGIAVGEEGLHIAEAVKHPVSLVRPIGVSASHTSARGICTRRCRCSNARWASVRKRTCRSISPCWLWLRCSVCAGRACRRGRAAARTGARADHIEQHHAYTGMRQLFTLGEAHLRAGRLEEAHTLAARALEYFRTHQERGHEAYALRRLGDIAAHREPPEVEEAEASYRQALALAEELGMRPLLAHCHLGLGTLYAKTGQREQAQAELSAAIDLYRAMEMTFWLPQAEAVLAQAGEAGGARRDGLSIQ